MTRLFSDKNRPVHLGTFPLERLARVDAVDLDLEGEREDGGRDVFEKSERNGLKP